MLVDCIEKMEYSKTLDKIIDKSLLYDNPYTYAVDPANFVFDSTQFNDFDSCPKIYKTWKTPDYIKSNKYFEISKEIADDSDALIKSGSNENDISNQNAQNLKDDVINGTTVEMLEHWGDLTLENGTVLKNWYDFKENLDYSSSTSISISLILQSKNFATFSNVNKPKL